MVNPRETRTNAADSAPGVDDGPAGVPAPGVNSRPGRRGAVFIGVLIVCLIVLGLMFMPRLEGRDGTALVNTGAARPAGGGQAPAAADQTGG
jgi:hypothetical protein